MENIEHGIAGRRLVLHRNGTIALLFVLAALAAADTALSVSSFILPVNTAILSYIAGIRLAAPWLTAPLIAVTYIGSGWVLFLIVLLLALWFASRYSKSDALWLVLTAISAQLVSTAVKILIHSRRPHLIAPPPFIHEFSGFSFPSGHALMSTVVFGSAALLLIRHAKSRMPRIAAGVVCAILVLLIGFSRMYLGAHWPNDVLGGYLYGTCILISAHLLRRPRTC